MKRVWLTLFILLSFACRAQAKDLVLPVIFITDTTEAEEEYTEPENITLKGYAEYMEDSEAIYLKDDEDQFVLNLKVPQKIASKSLVNSSIGIYPKKPMTYSKFGAEEYLVIPKDGASVVSSGGLSFGTNMEQEVDYGELEHTATMFTRYDKGKFGVVTAYERTIGSTYNNYFDNLYIAPELRLNKYMSIKEVLTADITRNRKKAELVFSLNPFAKTKDNRLNLELGASQTYDDQNSLIRERIKFNTRFKL